MTWFPKGPRGPRRIVAQRPGPCRRCGRWIAAGTDVLWVPRQGIAHAIRSECDPPQSQPQEARR